MQTFKLSLLTLGIASMLAMASCGKGRPPAWAESEAEEPPAASDSSASEGSGEDESALADTESASEESLYPASSETSPIDVLQQDGSAFMLNYRNSDMGPKKEESCEQQSGGDPAKKAKCFSAWVEAQEREAIMFFQQTDDKSWWYRRFVIRDNRPVELNRVKCEFGKPQGTRVTVTTSGPDKAAAPKGTVPGKLDLEVPDGFTVILHDPGRGKVVYDSKVGLFSAPGKKKEVKEEEKKEE